jgi:hypothetical protein
LEDRLVLSLTLLDLPGVPGRTIVPAHLHLLIPNLFQVQGTVTSAQVLKKVKREGLTLAVPNLSNLTFFLSSDDDAVPAPPPSEGNPGSFGPVQGMHTLEIKNQVFDAKGRATFDGLWDGTMPVQGALLGWDKQGLGITCSWAGHTLFGHITDTGVAWHLDGQVTETIPEAGGIPFVVNVSHVAGGTGAPVLH